MVTFEDGQQKADEKSIWHLLVRDFYWIPPDNAVVKVLPSRRKSEHGKVKFQLFEVMFATLMAELRSDYQWFVSPNRADEGTDFIGRSQFLQSEALGIAASITVGGQCKKREKVNDIVQEVGGSLLRMAMAENPTFFIVALAANLEKKRIGDAKGIIEHTHKRECQILERRQIEALFSSHMAVMHPLLVEALDSSEIEQVLAYFRGRSLQNSGLYEISAKAPERVLAGEPFIVDVEIRGMIEPDGGLRLRWRCGQSDGDTGITLVGPLGADHTAGAPVERSMTKDDNPMVSRVQLQLVSYAVGLRALGSLELITGDAVTSVVLATQLLQDVRIVENVRPRFYAVPVRSIMAALDNAYEAAQAGAVEAVSVVGSGGAGKSRVVEEFSMEVSRYGGRVVLAKQANTLDYPRRLFANLLIGLTDPDRGALDLASAVLARISSYDAALATAATATVTGLIGSGGKSGADVDDQRLISIILLLIRSVTRQRTLVLHLQDLHWCTADVLELLERILWQLEHLHGSPRNEGAGYGLVMVLEGRIGQEFSTTQGSWSTRAFEALLERLGKPVLHCMPFTSEQSEEFTRRLFEDVHSAHRVTSPYLLDLQASVASQIHRSASGNPFHILEQLKLLKHRGAVVQNQDTGLHYIVRPDAVDEALPPTIAESIRARWRYLRAEKPALAHLIWATALLSERISGALFRQLWSTLAPQLALEEIEATEFLDLSPDASSAVALRHENYFQTLRHIELPPEPRRKALNVYRSWLSGIAHPTAQQRFDLARIHLASDAPDLPWVAALLRDAVAEAEAMGDVRLTRRILGTLLDDVCWPRPDLFLEDRAGFLALCRDELRLCRSMMALGEREGASRRLERLDEQVQDWIQRPSGPRDSLREGLLLARFDVQVLLIRALMNHRQPARAAEVAREAVSAFDGLRRAAEHVTDVDAWSRAELELCLAYSVALALSGDIDGALIAGARAVGLATDNDEGLDSVTAYANFLLGRDPEQSERLLRQTITRATALPETGPTRVHLSLNLPMSLIVLAHRDRAVSPEKFESRLKEAISLLRPHYRNLIELGRLAQAAAAALLIGLTHTLRGEPEEVAWFADSVNAAARARQMETLWRAQLNLASSMHRHGHANTRVGEHARAAYEILADTLEPYPQPEDSHRFVMVRVPLAQAIRFMLLAGDPTGVKALQRFPTLLSCFDGPYQNAQLKADRGGFVSTPWLRLGEYDYAIY